MPAAAPVDRPLDVAALKRKRNAMFAVGGTFLGIGVALVGLAFIPRSNREDAWAALHACDQSLISTQAQCDLIYSDTQKYHLQWTAMWIAGAVTGIGLGLPFLLAGASTGAQLKRAQARVTPVLSPGYAGLGANLRF